MVLPYSMSLDVFLIVEDGTVTGVTSLMTSGVARTLELIISTRADPEQYLRGWFCPR